MILNRSIKALELTDAICVFPDHCFYECSSLSSLTIPNPIVEIGKKCFENCSSLQNFGISLQTFPKIINNVINEEHSFYSQARSDLFIGCPFKLVQ
jgi:hypothetical protein